MRRNWYAVIVIAVLGLVVCLSEWYLNTTVQHLTELIEKGETYAEAGNYSSAREQFECAVHYSERKTVILSLLIRRTALDKINETLAVLPAYADKETYPDLQAETERVLIQIQQMQTENSIFI